MAWTEFGYQAEKCSQHHDQKRYSRIILAANQANPRPRKAIDIGCEIGKRDYQLTTEALTILKAHLVETGTAPSTLPTGNSLSKRANNFFYKKLDEAKLPTMRFFIKSKAEHYDGYREWLLDLSGDKQLVENTNHWFLLGVLGICVWANNN